MTRLWNFTRSAKRLLLAMSAAADEVFQADHDTPRHRFGNGCGCGAAKALQDQY
jgi:hypothetical protein